MTDETSSSHSRRIAEQGVNALLILCRRGNRLAAGFLFIVTLICVTGFLLGYVATDGGTQTLWIVLGGFFALAAIGMVASVLFGLRRIRKNAPGLTTEIQALITGDVAAERTVVETVEATEAVEGESALVLSRQFTGFQTHIVRSNREFPALREAMRVVVRFPAHHRPRLPGINRLSPGLLRSAVMAITGRCLCGEVTYEFTGEPIATAVCHCDHCQRQGGGAFSVNLVGQPSQLHVTGELKTYTETGENDDGEYVHRRFCGSCGSPIVSELVGPGLLAVKVGTLDDKSAVVPTAEVWCVDRQPWVDLPGMAVSLEREG